MKLKTFYAQVYETLYTWHDNHTNFGAFVAWRECWWLPTELREDEDLAQELGWTLEEVEMDQDTYEQEYMNWYMKNNIASNGIPTSELIEQVEAVLAGLQSDDVWECLVSITLAMALAHTNGFILRDYFIGSKFYLIEQISQNGLEATFPDLDEFIQNYTPYFMED